MDSFEEGAVGREALGTEAVDASLAEGMLEELGRTAAPEPARA